MPRLPPRPAAVVFDLDGTLLDTGPGLTAAVAAARARFGLAPLTPAEVMPHVGGGLGDLLRATLPARHHGDLSDARAAFHRAYRDCLLDALPMAGADALVRALGPRAALVTNKPRAYLTPLLDHLGWRFGAVVDGDDAAGRKPDPGPLHRAAALLGVAPRAAVYVGDSPVDRAAARAAGMPFVAVAWGSVPDAPCTLDALAELTPWI